MLKKCNSFNKNGYLKVLSGSIKQYSLFIHSFLLKRQKYVSKYTVVILKKVVKVILHFLLESNYNLRHFHRKSFHICQTGKNIK